MSVINDNEPWPRYCSRCHAVIIDINSWNAGHGWDVFCNECEASYQEWKRLGKK
jgi:hypothetical protein